jgi:uncharacterized protein
MVELADLGFLKNTIFEVIVSTYNMNGTPNAAPMGAELQKSKTLSLKIFNSSQTSINLRTNKCGVINLTNNVEFFYKAALKEVNSDGKPPQDWFEKAGTINAPKLRLADATIEVTVADVEPIRAEKNLFSCNIERINVGKVLPQVYCRAMPATLEAILLATRVKVFAKEGNKKEQLSQLLGLIENCNEVVNHTAPNSVFSAIMADLRKRTNSGGNRL